MVTPDGQRTMRTFQGATTEFTGDHLNIEMFQGARLVHIEGYALFNEKLAERAMFYAKQAGALVSFDLASFEIVRANREHILYLLDTYVDLVFANEDEACMLFEQELAVAAQHLSKRCPIAVVTLGEEGSLIYHKKTCVEAPAYRITPVDTTGAGDLHTSGFLHGFLNGEPL